MITVNDLIATCFRGIETAAIWCASRPWRQRLLLAFILGSFSVLSLPPVGWLLTLPVAWTGFIWLLDGAETRRSQMATGWAFGFGYLCVGLYWISAALFTDIGKYWWLVPIALTALPAALALFWGIAALVAARITPARSRNRLLAIIITFGMVEFLRGTILSGFPWNLPGYAFLSILPVMQAASLIGSYGLTLLAIALGGAASCLACPHLTYRQRVTPPGLVIGLVLVLGIWGEWRLNAHPTTYRNDVVVRLVQPNIPQNDKWDAAERRANLDKLISLSNRLPVVEGSTMPRIVIWPETAVPYALMLDQAARQAVSLATPADGVLITGTPHREGDDQNREYFNSIIGINGAGNITGRYDKVKLVPFGEFLPLRDWLRPLGIDAIAAGSVDFSRGSGEPTPLLPYGLPQPLALVCYEAIFPGAFLDRALASEWIVNVTNDAWFGATAGPHQHFHIARARAIETGLPLVRVANTGLSGVVDPYGRILVISELNQVAVLDLPLPRNTGSLYAGLPLPANWGFLSIIVILLIVFMLCRRRPTTA